MCCRKINKNTVEFEYFLYETISAKGRGEGEGGEGKEKEKEKERKRGRKEDEKRRKHSTKTTRRAHWHRHCSMAHVTFVCLFVTYAVIPISNWVSRWYFYSDGFAISWERGDGCLVGRELCVRNSKSDQAAVQPALQSFLYIKKRNEINKDGLQIAYYRRMMARDPR